MRDILETLMAAARSRNVRAPGRCAAADVLGPLLGGMAGGRPDVRAVCTVPDDLVAGVDAGVLARIVAPVVQNAVRYAVEEVRIDAGQLDGSLSIAIADDGPGVAPEHVERVFEPGWRGDPSDGHDGAGLGLALAQRLATAAGGGIDVESDERGTRFVVELPGG
jgi:signal transduction histidine kinase